MNKKLGTAILLTGITTFTIHMINKVQFSFSTVKNILSCPNNKYYEWRFGKIRYIKKGSGSPVLLLNWQKSMKFMQSIFSDMVYLISLI